MAATIKVVVVTPEAKALEADADMVTLTGIEGAMGILAGHMPLMTQLVAGEIILKLGATTTRLAVGDGFVQVTGEKVSILTDMAVDADHIDEAKAQEALQRAEARLAQKVSDEEAATLQASVVNSSAQLRVKRAGRK
jgi:F-type H+-transporting ATPase subunit epsilon